MFQSSSVSTEGKEVRQRCQQSLSSHFFYAEPAFAEVFGAERLEGVNARYATMTTLLGRMWVFIPKDVVFIPSFSYHDLPYTLP